MYLVQQLNLTLLAIDVHLILSYAHYHAEFAQTIFRVALVMSLRVLYGFGHN